MQHRTQTDLEQAEFRSAFSGFTSPEGKTIGFGTTVGNGIEGWAPGAIFIDTDASADAQVWINEGTKTTAVWKGVAPGALALVDDETLTFGTGSDVTMLWDGALLRCGPASAMWGNAPSPAQADYETLVVEYFNDFVNEVYDFDVTNDWTVTEDDAADTQAITADTVPGILKLTQKATTDNDGGQVNYNFEKWKLATGKKLWFETRIRCAAGDATNLDFFVGLAEAEDLTGVADNMPANGIGFHKEDGDTNIDASSSDNGTNLQTAAAGTLVDATWIKLGLYFDGGATGAATITPYVNGVAGTPIASVTYATMAELAPLFMVRNGDATTTQTLEIDYVKVVQLR